MFKYRVMKRKKDETYGIQWRAWFWPVWTWQTTPLDGGAWTYLTFESKELADGWVKRRQEESENSKMRNRDWEKA